MYIFAVLGLYLFIVLHVLYRFTFEINFFVFILKEPALNLILI